MPVVTARPGVSLPGYPDALLIQKRRYVAHLGAGIPQGLCEDVALIMNQKLVPGDFMVKGKLIRKQVPPSFQGGVGYGNDEPAVPFPR